ncbi:unnamed protein product [Allacma fusca]|uniref:Ionotropic glutamate receptor C-terminal domain-containing protein n=1 Tax=Allacma fusca TaxID=39272 RepID=A0A8J2PWZ5_9HEXA|nr:unnamed protein product [Allacma fusca]
MRVLILARVFMLLERFIVAKRMNTFENPNNIPSVEFAAKIVITNFNQCAGFLHQKQAHDSVLHNYHLHSRSSVLGFPIPNYVTDPNGVSALNQTPVATRFGENCLFHVVTLETRVEIENYNNFLQKMSTPFPVPVVKRDADYFLFMVSKRAFGFVQKSLDDALITKIRHKLFIVIDDVSKQNQAPKMVSKFSVYHVCNYCIPSAQVQNLDQIDFRRKALFPNYIRNLNGHTLRASVPSAVVARVGLKFENGGYKTVRGLQLVLVNLLSQEMNFTYKVFPSSGGGGTGLQLPNGSWAGVVGDIYHDRADFGTGVGISYFRNPLITFLGYYEYISLVLVHGPTQKIFTWRTIFWPFKTASWIYLIFCALVSFFALICLQRGFERSLKLACRHDLSVVHSSEFQIHDIYTLLFVTLLSQGVKLPQGSSVRCFVAFWLLFAIVVSTAYTSKLFAFLVFPIHESAPQTFEELADSDYDVGLRYIGGAGYNSFKTSQTPALKTIFQRMELVKDSLLCFEKALNSRFCCISYELQFEYTVQRNLSDVYGRTNLRVAPGRVFPVSVGLGVQKGSIFGEQVNWKVQASFETGLVKKWSDQDLIETHMKKLGWRKEIGMEREVISNGREPMPLTVPHFTGAFTVWITGVLVAFTLLAHEIFQTWLTTSHIVSTVTRQVKFAAF